MIKLETDRCDRNSLKLNVNKTVIVRFQKQNLNDNNAIATRFLGIMIDHRISWVPHIDRVCSKLGAAYFAVLKLNDLITVRTRMQV